MQITQFVCFVTLFVMQSFAFSHFNMCSKTTLNAFFRLSANATLSTVCDRK